jgi:hypothetical protein
MRMSLPQVTMRTISNVSFNEANRLERIMLLLLLSSVCRSDRRAVFLYRIICAGHREGKQSHQGKKPGTHFDEEPCSVVS